MSIKYQGRLATVRYVGLTLWCNEPLEWVGIEFSLPVGKHDGVVGFTRYFSAKPMCALFVHGRNLVRVIASLAGNPTGTFGRRALFDEKLTWVLRGIYKRLLNLTADMVGVRQLSFADLSSVRRPPGQASSQQKRRSPHQTPQQKPLDAPAGCGRTPSAGPGEYLREWTPPSAKHRKDTRSGRVPVPSVCR